MPRTADHAAIWDRAVNPSLPMMCWMCVSEVLAEITILSRAGWRRAGSGTARARLDWADRAVIAALAGASEVPAYPSALPPMARIPSWSAM